MKKQKLNLDMNKLFPGESVDVCGSTITITPVCLEQVASLSMQFDFIVSKLKKEGVTFQNFNTPDNLFKIASLIIKDVPEVLSETANLELEDVKKLPPGEALKLINKVIDVNLKSKDDLLGNLNSLIEKLVPKDQEE